MSTQPLGHEGMPPGQALRLAFVVILTSLLAIQLAGVDPWLLVALAGLGVATYAVYDRTGDGWVAAA